MNEGHFEFKDSKEHFARADVQGLAQALQHPDVRKSRHLRGKVVEDLGNLISSEGVPALIETLSNDPDAGPRMYAAIALGKIDDSRGKCALRAAIGDSDRNVRLWAIHGLGLLRDRQSVEGLIDCLKDENTWIREYAARALGEIGDQRATESLVEGAQDSNRRVRKAAASALVSLGDWNAIEPLREAYGRASAFNRRPLGRALRELEEHFGSAAGS